MKFYFTFINEWNQFFHRKAYNWRNWRITFFNFEFEDDIIFASYEIQVVLLGLGFYITLRTEKKTEEMIGIEKALEDLKSGADPGVNLNDIKSDFMKDRCPRCYFALDKEASKKDE